MAQKKAQAHLAEVDSLEIVVLVDNEIDPMTPSQSPHVITPGRMMGIPLSPRDPKLGAAGLELRMDSICCGAHGLSLLITTKKGDVSHTLLFDTGPEEDVFERNVTRLRLDTSVVEHIHLSHWHRDHSGGMLRAIRMISQAKEDLARTSSSTEVSAHRPQVVADVHPDRPDFRGFNAGGTLVSLEADPSFEEIEKAGAILEKRGDVHAVLNDMFLVSGAIPRVTPYEEGIRGGIRYSTAKGEWKVDELISDERFVVCNLKGKGLVVFTGCSHAGVVNVCKHALELGGGLPLFAVVGGFHLADATPEKMDRSIHDLKELEPKVLMPGHCTGWRFKFLAETQIPGLLVPSFGGSKYTLQGIAAASGG